MSVYRCPKCNTILDEFGICLKCEVVYDLDDLEPETTIAEDYALWKELDNILSYE
jgi:hypothetical protein